MKDYRETLKKILVAHPEIAAINVEYKKVERLTIGEQPLVENAPIIAENSGYISPSGLKPIIPAHVDPALIEKLRGGATVETINILNAPKEEKK